MKKIAYLFVVLMVLHRAQQSKNRSRSAESKENDSLQQAKILRGRSKRLFSTLNDVQQNIEKIKSVQECAVP